MKTKAAFAGTFDPLTLGHLDLIKNASRDFSELTIIIGENYRKNQLFTPEERKKQLEKVIESEGLKNVKVVLTLQLVADVCAVLGIEVLIRGLRNQNDFTYEQEIAINNMYLNSNLNTLFYLAKPEYIHMSSSNVKELLKFNKDISKMVPEILVTEVKEKYENIQ